MEQSTAEKQRTNVTLERDQSRSRPGAGPQTCRRSVMRRWPKRSGLARIELWHEGETPQPFAERRSWIESNGSTAPRPSGHEARLMAQVPGLSSRRFTVGARFSRPT